MTLIKDYVLLLIGACLTCGVLTILAPSGSFEQIIRLIGSIFLLLCMISPMIDIFHEMIEYPWNHTVSDATDQTSNSWAYIAHTMEQTLTNTVNECVTTVTGRDAKDIDLEISINNQTFVVTDITIILYSSDSSKISAVTDYVAIKTGIRPTVICEQKGE